jgi:hypothetical protein
MLSCWFHSVVLSCQNGCNVIMKWWRCRLWHVDTVGTLSWRNDGFTMTPWWSYHEGKLTFFWKPNPVMIISYNNEVVMACFRYRYHGAMMALSLLSWKHYHANMMASSRWYDSVIMVSYLLRWHGNVVILLLWKCCGVMTMCYFYVLNDAAGASLRIFIQSPQ